MNPSPEIVELLQIFRDRDQFLLTSHARPDGDALGSALGLMHFLEAMGKQVIVAFADPIPLIYRSLPGAGRIVAELPPPASRTAILLECDSIERSGYASIEADYLINIDHHLSGKRFADFNWIDPQCCAVGAMIYDLAVASSVEITPDMATCLYTAVLTDTGSFTYSCTTASTFALAEHLVLRGASASKIAQAVYFSNPASKFHLLGAALRNLHVEGAVAWTWVTQQEIAKAHAEVEDCEGVVNYLIGISGVEAAVFLRELPEEEASPAAFRLSIRSKGAVDVARVADSLGGGGHRNASGCTLPGPLEAATHTILAKLRAEV